nr:6400_t:CDS:2 [Entrophospora candida]
MHIKKITQERVKKGKVLKINSTIAQIDPKNLPVLERAISDFKEAQSSNTSSLLNRQETLFNNIRNMTDDSKSNALDLFDNMKYPKGRNQGKIISPHIQKKAIDFLNYGLYKKKSTIKDLEEENKELKSQIKKFGKEKEKLIKKTQSLGASKQHFKTKSEKRVSTIRSLVRKSGNFSENEFKNQNCPKTPSSYLNDWKLFLSWLTSTNLNVQIRCLVRLGEIFYEPLMQFMIGQDPHPRIYTESGFKNLPNGRRAHEMPDKVTEWLSFLRDLKENFDIIFGQELLEALESLDSDEWGSLYDSLERGIIKALEHFENWMLPWLHLPLSICRLGGDNGQAFARSYYYVFFSKSWVNEPSQIEINYAEQLQNDVENFFTDDFGLQNRLTQNQEFKKEFEEFCNTLDPTLSNFQLLYSFVKEKIYCIIIHQQQVEGLFNKLDLKTHDNMSINTKKAKIQLTNGPIDKINIENNLNEIRAQQKRQKLNVLQENIQQHYGQNYANSLYSNLFQN